MTLWYVEVFKKANNRERLRRVVRYVVLAPSADAAKIRVNNACYGGRWTDADEATSRPWTQAGAADIVRLGTEIRQH